MDSSKPIVAKLLAMVTTMGPIELTFLGFLMAHVFFAVAGVFYITRWI